MLNAYLPDWLQNYGPSKECFLSRTPFFSLLLPAPLNYLHNWGASSLFCIVEQW
jgi:hypothetical protein